MKRFLLVVMLVALGAFAPAAYAGDPTPSPVEREFVGLLNEERAAHDLPAVEISPALTEIGDDYAALYASSGAPIDHANDPPYAQRAQASGCSGWDGPVLAQGYTGAQPVLEGWLSSPGHRAVLLDPTITHVGPASAGSYWLAFGMTCESNAANTSGDFGALPGGGLEIGKPKARGKLIRAKVTTTIAKTRVRLIAKRGRTVIRGPREPVAPGDPGRAEVRVTRDGRWKLWLSAGGDKHKLGAVKVG